VEFGTGRLTLIANRIFPFIAPSSSSFILFSFGPIALSF
jgi:hypothetical protein